MKKIIINYKTNQQVYNQAIKSSCTPLQAIVLANRYQQEDKVLQLIQPVLSLIQPPSQLIDCKKASQRLVKAIQQGSSIGILTDYDVDGISSHAIIFYALRDFFQIEENRIISYIGHRLNDGYGISQGLVDRILDNDQLPAVIITADCGTSDEPRIARLKQAGIDVLVTDHHAIPDTGVPESAYATINPTRSDCSYQDKTIAGCMVSWLLMSQLRADLIAAGIVDKNTAKLSSLLDFVSLGTIADAVSLSSITNRAVVKAGLNIMNRLQRPCWREMLKLLDKTQFSIEDLGFQIGPRINARSRMADPFQALYFVTAANDKQANKFLQKIDEDNKQRKLTEKQMLVKAKYLAKEHIKQFNYTMLVFDEDFHPGIQGIVASRLVDLYGRPTIVFSASSDQQILTASARTIAAIHIRNILQQIDKLQPGLLLSYGGHKGAAGLKINKENLAQFTELFDRQIELQIKDALEADKNNTDNELNPVIYIDGALTHEQLDYNSVQQLEQLQPYGREFEPPCFLNSFIVQFIRQLGKDGEHLSLLLIHDDKIIRSIWFNALEKGEFPDFVEGDTIDVVYQIIKDDYRGEGNFQLNIKYIKPLQNLVT